MFIQECSVMANISTNSLRGCGPVGVAATLSQQRDHGFKSRLPRQMFTVGSETHQDEYPPFKREAVGSSPTRSTRVEIMDR